MTAHDRMNELKAERLSHNEDEGKFTQLGDWADCFPDKALELADLQSAASE